MPPGVGVGGEAQHEITGSDEWLIEINRIVHEGGQKQIVACNTPSS